MDKQKTRRAAPQLVGRAAARLAQLWNEEHLHTLIKGVQRFVLCAVLARGTVLGGYTPFGLSMAAALMARGGGAVRDRRTDLRGHAAGRGDQKRGLCGGGTACAVRDKCMRGLRIVTTRWFAPNRSHAGGRGVYLCIPARRPGAADVGCTDLCRRAGADVRRMPGIRSGARPAAGRQRLAAACDPAGACRDRAAQPVQPQPVWTACACAHYGAGAGAGGRLSGRFGRRRGGRRGIRRGNGSVRRLRGAVHLLLRPVRAGFRAVPG